MAILQMPVKSIRLRVKLTRDSHGRIAKQVGSRSRRAGVRRFTFTAKTAPVPLPISSQNLRGSISTWPQCKGCAVVGEATGQSCSFRQPLLSKLQPFWVHSPDKAFGIIAGGDGCWALCRLVPNNELPQLQPAEICVDLFRARE